MEHFLQLLSNIHPLSQGLATDLQKILKKLVIPKKHFFLEIGQISKRILFIDNGIFRCFYTSQEKEISSWFMKEGDVIISVESFFTQAPSHEAIQALEDSSGYYITFEELNFLYKKHIEFNIVGRILTEKYYTLSEQRLRHLRLLKATERYEIFRSNFSELVQRVPSGFIASYLGLSLETLSRIKNPNKRQV